MLLLFLALQVIEQKTPYKMQEGKQTNKQLLNLCIEFILNS
jgi:hypothetical protein